MLKIAFFLDDDLNFACVCVCVCVCVFISFHRKDFSWLNKTLNVMPEFRSAMLCSGNNSVPSTFVATSLKILVETFKLPTVQKSVKKLKNHR